MDWHTYLSADRVFSLLSKRPLPQQAHGSVLFADLAGFTHLTEVLRHRLGDRQGAETLFTLLENVYDALSLVIGHFSGHIICFSGDALTVWFPNDSGKIACTCAIQMLEHLQPFHEQGLSLKIGIAAGAVQRYTVGQAHLGLQDVLAGATVIRMARAEKYAQAGQIVVSAEALPPHYTVLHWYQEQSFACIGPQNDIKQPTSLSLSAHPLPSLDDNHIKPWLLPSLYQHLLQGSSDFLTELRPCTALFMRFTGLDYDKNPKAAEILQDFTCAIQNILHHYHGALIQITFGDKGSYLYACFGAPISHENDFELALQSALQIQKLQTPFQLQIGICSGVILSGFYGSKQRKTYGILGSTVNLAARLMENAPIGHVWVPHDLAQNSPAFCWQNLSQAIHFKGQAKPILVSQLSGIQRKHQILNDSSMVGRDYELSQLLEYIQPLTQNQGVVISICGEAGMGKNILCQNLYPNFQNCKIYTAECYSYTQHNPYSVWNSLWYKIFDLRSEFPILSQLESKLPKRLHKRLPLLGSLLGVNIKDNLLTANIGPEIRKTLLGNLLLDCLRYLCNQSNLALVLDDIQWIDDTSIEILKRIANGIIDLPIALIIVHRPLQIDLGIDHLKNYQQVYLNKLSRNDSHLLYNNILQAKNKILPKNIINQALDISDGNPFYLNELINYLCSQPAHKNHDKNIELPNSLHQLILSKTDELNSMELIILKVACIIGKSFHPNELKGYYIEFDSVENFEYYLSSLESKGFIHVCTEHNNTTGTTLDQDETYYTYSFNHSIIHEVIYESISFALRSQLHERFAAFLECSGFEQKLDILAYHYGRSKNTAKKCHYLWEAAEWARCHFMDTLAEQYYISLLTIEQKARVYFALGEVQARLGKLKEACISFRAPLANIADPIVLSKHLTMLGNLETRLGHFDVANIHFQEALMLDFYSVEIYNGLSWLCHRQGKIDEALSYGHTALFYSEQSKNPLDRASSLRWIARIFFSQGELTRSKAFTEEAMVIYTQNDDLGNIIHCLNALAQNEIIQLNYEKASEVAMESLRISSDLGYHGGIALNNLTLGWLNYLRGDYILAEEYTHKSAEMYQQIGNDWETIITKINLGHIYSSLGNLPEAYRYYTLALSSSSSNNSVPLILETLAGLANLMYLEQKYHISIALLSTVLNHPACNHEIHVLVSRWRPEAEQVILAHIWENAWKLGLNRDVDFWVAEYCNLAY